MKVKIKILICTGLMLNDHSNPYIESTTVLSDRQTDRGRVELPRWGSLMLAPTRRMLSIMGERELRLHSES